MAHVDFMLLSLSYFRIFSLNIRCYFNHDIVMVFVDFDMLSYFNFLCMINCTCEFKYFLNWKVIMLTMMLTNQRHNSSIHKRCKNFIEDNELELGIFFFHKPFHGQDLPLEHWMEKQLIQLSKLSKPIIKLLGKKYLTTN